MFRVYVERRDGFQNEAARIRSDVTGFLGITGVTTVRYLNRYDIEHVSETIVRRAATGIFSEPQSDICFFETLPLTAGETVIAWEYLPGQYDQRADSAEQCLSLLIAALAGKSAVAAKTQTAASGAGEQPVPRVRCAHVAVFTGDISAHDVERIAQYLINPVDSQHACTEKPQTLSLPIAPPPDIPTVAGFIAFDAEQLETYRTEMALAMDAADMTFLQHYFKSKNRDPTETEIRVLDTYWSDHCRHTTFSTELDDIRIAVGPYERLFRESLETYTALRAELYASSSDKPVTLMDIATIGARFLRKHGTLSDLEISAENNACSLYVDVKYTTDEHGTPYAAGVACPTETWLLMFKNETHNHPTEIEPFGGAATCIGGAIRDPLSGRTWVYQSMRITGAADPTAPRANTMPGKLPQLKIVREAARGFSSYGNQIGLATGQVAELYHPGYAAKRMELGAVIAAAPAAAVVRAEPAPGDKIILIGGGTGRDGIGGATGSSKIHTEQSVATAGAEVQKGNAVEERKIQRLFRNSAVSKMILRSNDFGAGGVAVAVGELAAGVDISLDAVPKKYEGLNGTEIALSESQERMAVVVHAHDVDAFIAYTAQENLRAVVIADVTDTNRLVMHWRGKTIVNIERTFLETAGAPHRAHALITSPLPPQESPLVRPLAAVEQVLSSAAGLYETEFADAAAIQRLLVDAWLTNSADMACCSQRGLGEQFDGTIGAATVLFPYGGRYQATPEAGMVAKLPVSAPRETATVSMMTYGFDPRVSEWSPWHGAQIAVLSSLAKITCLGGDASRARLSFQEFFGRPVDAETWGYPLAALLGALSAQKACGTAAIGGKDSMSGTFEKLSVPHTLVSFAVAHDDEANVTSGALKRTGSAVYLVMVPYSDELAPDMPTFMKNAARLYELNTAHSLAALYPVGAGGIADAVTKMAFGNRIGIQLDVASCRRVSAAHSTPVSSRTDIAQENRVHSFRSLFVPLYGVIIVETEKALDADSAFVPGTVIRIGTTVAEPEIRILFSETKAAPPVIIPLANVFSAWETTLTDVFPPAGAVASDSTSLPGYAQQEHNSLLAARRSAIHPLTQKSAARRPQPRILIPIFPGTNCEYDVERAFLRAGGAVRTFVFANNTPCALADSLDTFAHELTQAQILMLAGGFSAGDEPDGSGKFIANVLREPRISDAIMDLLKRRDGLLLGICNGFQALIKTGLVPYGDIRPMTADSPTLTFNTIGHHISRMVRTRMVSARSPWAQDTSVLQPRVHVLPISHGEGRIVLNDATAKALFKNGQVFAQYVDDSGRPTLAAPDNPNGSWCAIESLTSPDGHVLGKMGHNERMIGSGLCKNIMGNTELHADESGIQDIFTAGVRYFQ
ncbi:MAG: phosphoribosylformylglycinamidine synthase [Treponema sp.]|nr:phosphoribosylformylglycinamidine synthase [Treponema sp.]